MSSTNGSSGDGAAQQSPRGAARAVGGRPGRPRVFVDFSLIPQSQDAMHGRLLNWGRFCTGIGPGGNTAPMFRFYRSPQHWNSGYAKDTAVPVNREDAHRIALGISALPFPHRKALQWYYVERASVPKGCRALQCSPQALARYVLDGRHMLIERGV